MSVTTTFNGTLAASNTFYRPWTPADIDYSDNAAYDNSNGSSYTTTSDTVYLGNQVSQTSNSVVIDYNAPIAKLYNYSAATFTPNATGTFNIAVTAADLSKPSGYEDSGFDWIKQDTWIAVYEGGFDPTNPLTNLKWCNDDTVGGTGDMSSISGISLTSGTSYIIVMTSFVAGQTGAYTFTVTGDSGGDFVAGVPAGNATPSLGGTFTTAGAVDDNATITPFSGVTYTDADGTSYTVDITYTGANGTLAGTGLVNNSSGNYTLTGSSAADVQDKLQALVFTPTENQVAAGSTVDTTFTLTPNDGTVSGTADNTTVVTATSINSAPAIARLGGDSVSTPVGTSINIDGGVNQAATVTDGDSPNFADQGSLYIHQASGTANGNFTSDTNALRFDVSGVTGTDTPAAGGTPTEGKSVYVSTIDGWIEIGVVNLNTDNGSAGSDGQGGHDLWITLNTSATPALASLVFQNLQYAASTVGTRTFDATITDGISQSDLVTFTVDVTAPVNAAPVITGLDGDLPTAPLNYESYIDQVDDTHPAVSVDDNDSTDFDGGALLITPHADQPLGHFCSDVELVKFGDDGHPLAAESVSVKVEGNWVIVGEVHTTAENPDGFKGQSGNPLQIDLNANATPATTTLLLQGLQYVSGFVGERTFDLTLSDGDGATSDTSTFTLTVEGAPPPTHEFYGSWVVSEDATLSLRNKAVVRDDDTAETLTVTLSVDQGTLNVPNIQAQSGITPLDINGMDGSVSFSGMVDDINALLSSQEVNYSPAQNANGTAHFTITTSDGGTPVVNTHDITITAVNDTPTFDVADGGVWTRFGADGYAGSNASALQPDGKIVVAGYVQAEGVDGESAIAVLRLNADGSFDDEFGSGGLTDFNDGLGAESVAILPDGKILIAGLKDNNGVYIARLNSDGTPDDSFSSGQNGFVSVEYDTGLDALFTHKMIVQPDGKILLVGTQNLDGGDGGDTALVRYNADGTLDTTFGAGNDQDDVDGVLVLDLGGFADGDGASAVAIDADGKIVIAGGANHDFAVARFLGNGVPDTSFNSDGAIPGLATIGFGSEEFFTDDEARSIAIQSDGKIVVVGDSGDPESFVSSITLARLNADGTPDIGFGTDGDGKVVASEINTTLSGLGFESGTSSGYAVAIDQAENILVGGEINCVNPGVDASFRTLIKYNSSGELDTTFGTNNSGYLIPQYVLDGWLDDQEYEGYTSLLVQPDGKIVMAGWDEWVEDTNYSEFAIYRVYGDGTADTQFGDERSDSVNNSSTDTYVEAADSPVTIGGYEWSSYVPTIFDVEQHAANNYAGGTLTIQREGGAKAEDVLGFNETRLTAGGVSLNLETGALTDGEGTVATFVFTNTHGTLTIQFGSAATQSLVDVVTRSITYANTNTVNPGFDQGGIDLEWKYNDGGSSGIVTSTASMEIEGTEDGEIEGTVTVSGTPTTGTTLTISGLDTITDPDLVVTIPSDPNYNVEGSVPEDDLEFQWQVSSDGGLHWDDIEDATDSTFTVTADENGKKIHVVVRYRDVTNGEETELESTSVGGSSGGSGGSSGSGSGSSGGSSGGGTTTTTPPANTTTKTEDDGTKTTETTTKGSDGSETKTTETVKPTGETVNEVVTKVSTDTGTKETTHIETTTPTGAKVIEEAVKTTTKTTESDGSQVNKVETVITSTTGPNITKIETTTTPTTGTATDKFYVAVTAPTTTTGGTTTTTATTESVFVDLYFGDSVKTTSATHAVIPVGVAVTSTGARTPTSNTAAVADYIKLIDTTAGTTETNKTNMIGGGQSFLKDLAATATAENKILIINSLTLAAATTTTGSGLGETAAAPNKPIEIDGAATNVKTDGGGTALPVEAIVVDTRALAKGTQININNVEMAVFVGEDFILRGGEGKNTVFTGQGSQDIRCGADDDELHAGDGDDKVGSEGGDDKLYGDGGNDTVYGGEGNDSLYGGDGNDYLHGDAGDDLIDGGAGINTASYYTATSAVSVTLLKANKVQDTLGGGKDKLVSIRNLQGSDFNDTLVGDKANNTIEGGLGNDAIDGGAGKLDIASYANAAAGVTVSLSLKTAQNTGGAGTDTLKNVEGVIGSAFVDTLTGSKAKGYIDGGAGNDTLITGFGIDTLIGGLGSDTIDMGPGGGRDMVRYNSAAEGGDTVLNFFTGWDRFEFLGSAFGNHATGKLAKAEFISGAGATAQTAAQHFVFDTTTGNLYFDADGSGTNAQVLIATIGHATLKAADIWIV